MVLEALTNIQKHANATQVNIQGMTVNGGVTLTISDNGKGFDDTRRRQAIEQKSQSGFGLQNMGDRVLSLGGQFDVKTQPHAGTEIHVFIPL